MSVLGAHSRTLHCTDPAVPIPTIEHLFRPVTTIDIKDNQSSCIQSQCDRCIFDQISIYATSAMMRCCGDDSGAIRDRAFLLIRKGIGAQWNNNASLSRPS